MVEKIDTVIVGAGQAGLSLSYYLVQAGREHVILDKADQVADAWRNHRWDSFTLVTPNWSFKLPGAEYAGGDPKGFMLKKEIVQRFEQYAQENHLPVRCSTEVIRIEPQEGHYRYRVFTNSKIYESRNVVIATGMFQQVKVPAYAQQIPHEVHQVTSDEYKNPQALPPGAVLLVGSGQSGCQIAEELYEAGRKVYLSTGSAGRVPRRYRGLDTYEWLYKIGFFERTAAMLESPKDRMFAPPHVSGKGGGRTLNLHQFCRDGIILLGHTQGFEQGKMVFAPDLKENLAKADGFADNIIGQIDTHILNHALDIPVEQVPVIDDGFRAPMINSLDLAAEGIGNIIWATGYSCDYSLLPHPILDPYNYPSADRGVTPYAGLYFLGLAWMNKFNSGLLMGIGESARYLAEVIGRE
ncbi:MAG: NAD(P)-binding domain-containing protein [Acidobacteriaceae bacterium]